MIDRPLGKFASALLIVLLLDSRAQAAEPPLEVSTFPLQAIDLSPPAAKALAQAVSADGWRTLTPRETKGLWNELPSGSSRGSWLSVVTLGFNGQADAYAFQFNGPDGAMSQAAHVPFRQVWMPNETMAWIWPQEELFGALRVQLESARRTPLRPLALRVIPWRQDAGDAQAEKTNLEEARATDPKRVFDAVSVMAQAAAFEAGWAPTPAKSEDIATCEIRVEDQTCSFRLTFEGRQGQRQMIQERVPCEAYHEHLVRLFRLAQPGQGVSDFTQLKRGPLELLSVDAGRLAVLSNQELAVFDLQNGKRLWTTETPASARRPSDRYTACRTLPGGVLLLQFAGELAQFDGATGQRTVIARGGADSPFHLDGSGSEWVVARGMKTEFLRSGVSVWKSEQSAPITAGPTLTAKHVVLGDTGGELVARARADGVRAWKRDGLGRLQGRPVPAGELLLVFANDTETLIALTASTGEVAWRRTVGDVLLHAPIADAQRVLVVTKSNRLSLLDTKTGAVLAERPWPTWLVRATKIETSPQRLLVCTDIAGTVSLLSLEDLKTQKTFELSAELTGPILYVEQLASKWPVERAPAQQQDDLLTEIQEKAPKKGPLLLAADHQGFVYFLPLFKPE